MNKMKENICEKKFDVVIVGAGPGGLFAAYELAKNCGQNIGILVIDKGKDISERSCPALENSCEKCKTCHLISGGGGAGLFSDGKITLNLRAGSGHLGDIWSERETESLRRSMIRIMKQFSSSWMRYEKHHGESTAHCLREGGLKFDARNIMHFGTYNVQQFLKLFILDLRNRGVEFLFDAEVNTFANEPSGKWSIDLEIDGRPRQIVHGNYLIVAVGKEGQHWFSSMTKKMGGHSEENNVYSGVRLEINDRTARPLYRITFDPKIRGNDVRIKTHCFCRHGQILLLRYFDLPLLGGHTKFIETDEGFSTTDFPNSNLAILYNNPSISSWAEAIDYMKRVDAITNGDLLIQRLGDYFKGVSTTHKELKENSIRPSNSNTMPGRLSEEILPGFRDKFLPFLKRIDACVPGFLNPDNLIYAPAVEWWSSRIEVNNGLEVKNIENLYAVGDCSGVTLGLFQSAATGIKAAQGILRKIKGG